MIFYFNGGIEMADKKNVDSTSRRAFLKTSGVALGGLIVGGGVTSLLTGKASTEKKQTKTTKVDYSEALQFFKRSSDFDALSAATEAIYPEDENGPGAIKLGVPYYIDKQLAGSYGHNVNDYMKIPFQEGEAPLYNADIILQGVRRLNEVSNTQHKRLFKELTEDQQIEILTQFEQGKVKMRLVNSALFFALLRKMTLEGCYCDPVYGGNKNMAGWKMKEYPGAQMSYANIVEEEKFVKMQPVSLASHK